MKILKPTECDTSSYPAEIWYEKYPQGIEPLDLPAKRHIERFEEDPEFKEQGISYSKD